MENRTMCKKPCLSIIALAIGSALFKSAIASSITLVPSSNSVVVGNAMQIAISANIDTPEAIIGYGFDLSLNPGSSLSLIEFTPSPQFADDPINLAPISDSDGIRGAVNGDLFAGGAISGNDILLGTLHLKAIDVGTEIITLGADDLDFFYTEGLIPEDLGLTNFLPPIAPITINTLSAPACGSVLGSAVGAGACIENGTLMIDVNNQNITGTLDLGNAGGSVDSNSNNGTVSGVISGAGGLTKVGLGVLTLTGINTYAGGTNLNGGTLSVGNEANLGDLAGVLNFNGGVLQVTGTTFTHTQRTLNWGAAGGGFDIADPANNFTVDQSLSGTGGLTKFGSGILTLTGANTFTGGTTIDQGIVALNGSLGSGVTVNSDGTLRGAGIINGNTTVSGRLAPGNSPGTLTSTAR